MTFSSDSIASIRTAADIASVVGDSVKLTGKGRELFGLCPFHSEKSPSFSVSPEKGVYHCFGCGASGDVVDFVMKTRGLSFADAIRDLASRFGVTLEEDRGSAGPGAYELPKSRCPKPATPPACNCRPPEASTRTPDPSLPPLEWVKKATAFVLDHHIQLIESKAAVKKLKRTRGIRLDTAKRFYLGMNPEDFWRPRKLWGLPDVEGRDGKIFKNFCIDKGMVIPKIEKDSRVQGVEGSSGERLQVIRIRIRRPEGEPKYKLVTGSSTSPLVIPGSPRVVVIVESELCAILLSQEIGDMATVIATGSAQAKPDPSAASVLQSAHVILNALDFDAAGAAAASVFWKTTYPQNIRWPVPEGKDPTDAFLAGVSLLDWVRAGIPGMTQFGASTLGRKKKGKGEKKESDAMDQGPEAREPGMDEEDPASKNAIPEGVMRLAKLLTGAPVVIVNGESLVSIKEPRAWVASHWDVSKAISDLVYFDQEVFAFIIAHPEKAITGKNLMATLK